MINSLSIIKKITYLVFILIFGCIIFIANHIFNYAQLPINEILIKGEYQHIDRDQINLISEEYVNGNFFNVNLYEALDTTTPPTVTGSTLATGVKAPVLPT